MLRAPMPGVVKAIDCAVDEQVEEGTALVTLEAMKMQNPLFAPKSGKVCLTLDFRSVTVLHRTMLWGYRDWLLLITSCMAVGTG